MAKIKKILAPTDLSEASQIAVRYALELAKALGAEVTAYHAVNDSEVTAFAETLKKETGTDLTFLQADRLLKSYQLALARFLNDHFPDLIPWVRIREKVEIGVPGKSVLQWAEHERSDLIVISVRGTEEPSGAERKSTVEMIVAGATCPVLSLHATPAEKDSEEAAAVA